MFEESPQVIPGDLPTLIGLGPIRSGTTWVHEMLFGHSQVATTRLKEVNFFNQHFDEPAGWYAAQFSPTTPATRLRADMSPFYMMDPAVCDRIARTVPNPILMINLRSPYERVLSWYQKYKQQDFPIDALVNDPDAHAEALEIGLTATMLEEYTDRFGRDRLILVDYADLKRDPAGLAERLQRRLGLEVEIPPSVTREVNASVRYRNGGLRWAAHRVGPVVRKMAPHLFYSLKFGLLHDVIFAKQRLVGPSAEQKLAAITGLKAAFEADIDRLERALDRDLTSWRFEAQAAALVPHPVAAVASAPVLRPRGVAGWATLPKQAMIEARALWSLAWDPKVPLRARFASLVVASYLITPLDIIPNRIPIFGHLDEAVTIPLAIALFLWLSPSPLVRRHREIARRSRGGVAA